MQNYFINIEDRFLFKKYDDSKNSIQINLVMKLTVIDLNFSIKLLAWSNTKQTNVPLDESFYSTDIPASKAHEIKEYYTKITCKYLIYLKNTVNTHDKLMKYIFTIKNPIFVFHPKLLNVFSKRDLESITKKYFNSNPILNCKNFKEFLPIKTDGWYTNDIEVSTDLDENLFPLIENNDGSIVTPSKLLEYLL